MRALAAPVVGLICAFHWKAWLLRCRCSWANGPNNMSAAHDGGTAEKKGQFPILAPGRAVGQVEYGAARVSACDIARAGPPPVARESTADRTDRRCGAGGNGAPGNDRR